METINTAMKQRNSHKGETDCSVVQWKSSGGTHILFCQNYHRSLWERWHNVETFVLNAKIINLSGQVTGLGKREKIYILVKFILP